MSHTPSRCVYTVLTGNYERLNEQPLAARSQLPMLCLTDNPALRSDHWQIVPIQPAFAMDPIRSQRVLKICPHMQPELRGFDASLYIDNTVLLQVPPDELFEALPWSSGLGLPQHSFRQTVHDEFIEVARLGFDDPARIFEQLNHYLLSDPDALEEPPCWTAIMLRDHRQPRVQRAMECWRDHVLRYSRRDQLSANIAFRSAGLVPDRWPLDNYRSRFHSWPHAPERDRFAGPRDPSRAWQPIVTQWRAAQQDAQDLRHQLEAAQGRVQALTNSLQALEQQRAQSQLELAHAQHQADAQAQARAAAWAAEAQSLQAQWARERAALVQEFHASASWRLTAPLRWLMQLWRRV